MEIIKELDKTNRKYFFFMKAVSEASESTAQKRKVGAVLTIKVINNTSIVEMWRSDGYNKEITHNKCENTQGETYSYTMHAEAVALANSKTKQCHALYVTFSPCIECCKLIALFQIKELYFMYEHDTNFSTVAEGDDMSPLQFLENNGVKVFKCSQELADDIVTNSGHKDIINYINK